MTNQSSKPIELCEAELQQKQFRFAKLLSKARSLETQGNAHEEALNAYTEALDAVMEYNPDSLDVAHVLNQMGLLLMSMGPIEEADEHFQKALGIRLDLVGEEAVLTAQSYLNLGTVQHLSGNAKGALKFYEKSVSILLKNDNAEETRPLLIVGLKNLYQLFMDDGNEESANKYLELAQGFERTGNDLALFSRGIQHLGRGEIHEAIDLLRDYVERVEVSAPGSENHATGANFLGLCYMKIGKLELASRYFNESLTMSKKLNVPELVAQVTNNLGIIETSRMNSDKALIYFQEAVKLWESSNLEGGALASAYANMAKIYSMKQDIENAKYYVDLAAPLAHLVPKEDFVTRNNILSSRGFIALLSNNFDEAIALFEEVAAVCEESYPNSPDHADALGQTAFCYLEKGDTESLRIAESLYKKSYSMLNKVAPQSILIGYVLFHMGQIHDKRGNMDLALKEYKRALELLSFYAPEADLVEIP